MKLLRRFVNAWATFTEMLGVLWEQKRWWLIPLFIILTLFAILVVLGSSSPLGPFIYTLF